MGEAPALCPRPVPRASPQRSGGHRARDGERERVERSRLRLEKQKTGEGRVFSSSEEQTIPSLRPLLTCAKISHAVCCEVSESRAWGAAGAAGLTRRTGAPCASVPPPPPPRPMRQAQVVVVDDLDVDGCIDVERPPVFLSFVVSLCISEASAMSSCPCYRDREGKGGRQTEGEEKLAAFADR